MPDPNIIEPGSWPEPDSEVRPAVLEPAVRRTNLWGYMRNYVPAATYVLIAANFVMFVLATLAGGSEDPNVLLDFGASYAPLFHQGQYWRLVMPMFLHIGWWHLAVNMYSLYALGPLLERMYGYGRYSFIYVMAGITGSLLSILRSNNVAAGASGAIFGVAGAILVAGYVHRDAMPYPLARIFQRNRFSMILLIFVVVNLVFGYAVANIDNWGHLGGLAGGALLALLIPPPHVEPAPSYVSDSHEKSSQGIVIIPVAIVVLAMAVTASHYRAARQVSHLLDAGDRLRSSRQLDEALDKYRQAERLAANDERPHLGLASLYAAQGKLDDAMAEFTQALRVNPKQREAQLGLGLIYQQKGNLAEAQKLIQAALGTNPSSADGQEELADICAGQKLYKDAIEHYGAALRLEPKNPVTHNNLAWLLATSEDPKFRNPSAALEHARRAVELSNWKQPEFIDTLAEAFFAAGNFTQAVETQKKALQLEPNNPEYRQHMERYRKAAGV